MARDLDDAAEKYQPILEYRYEVDGVQRRGSRISFAPTFNRHAFERALVVFHRYPPGKAVTIYYDPRHPERSVIEPGLSWPLAMQFVGGLVLIAAAFVTPA
jgi:hypothetical protein